MSEQEQFEQEQMQQNDLPEQTEQTAQTEVTGWTEQTAQTEVLGQTEQTAQPEAIDQGGQIDNGIYTTPDVYQTQTVQEIYRTPDIMTESEHHNTGGVFSGDQPVYDNNTQDYQSTYNNGQSGNNIYGNEQVQNSIYVNNAAESGYVNGQPENNADGNGQPQNNVYGNNPQYGNNTYANAPYENNPYGKKTYGSNQPGNNAYGNNQNANNQYGNNQYGNNPYGNPYAPDSYGYNPYSPYAAPVQKKNTGLIIGVIAGIAILFLIAVFALFYHAIEMVSDKKERQVYDEDLDEVYRDRPEEDYEDYFNDDRAHRDDDYNYDDYNYGDYNYGDYNYDGYDDYDDYNYDDDEYYTLHDDIKDLSYTIDWEYFDYDANGENVMITVEYPVIVKGRIPNQEKINDVLESEIGFFTDYYENEYSKYMGNSNSYFYASAVAYITYMSEDVLSVVFSEAVYSDYFDSISLYCINIDVENGVILDNTDILSVDDDFSVDFRYRSQRQNGSVDALDRMSDQEITEMLTSSGSLIIFYTPQGMEVGLNHENGYVTVTYHDYKDYLNTF